MTDGVRQELQRPRRRLEKEREDSTASYELVLDARETLYLFGRGFVALKRGSACLDGLPVPGLADRSERGRSERGLRILAPFCGPAAAIVVGLEGASLLFAKDNAVVSSATAQLLKNPFGGDGRFSRRGGYLTHKYMLDKPPVRALDPAVPDLFVVTKEFLDSRKQLGAIAKDHNKNVDRVLVLPSTRSYDRVVQSVVNERVVYTLRSEDVYEEDKEVEIGQSVLVAGGKGLGKTTIAKAILNGLVQTTGCPVAWLEGDVRNPEFGPRGIVSLTIIHEIVQGPSFTHVKNPDTAYYFGDNSCGADQETYLKMMHALLERFCVLREDARRHGQMLHLVVNTEGWIMGTGYDTLLSLCKMAMPRHVIQVVPRKSTLLPGQSPRLFSEEDVNALKESGICLHEVEGPSLAQVDICSPFSLRERFDAHMLLYFNDHITPLLSAPAYCVPFHAITLIPVGSVAQNLVPSDAFKALNGMLVGLGSCDSSCFVSKAASSRNSDLPHLLLPKPGTVSTPAPLIPCVGLAVVRSINVKKRFFELITPINPMECHVNVIMWDNHVELPVGIAPLAWNPQKNELITAPYVASTALTEANTGAAEINAIPSATRHPIILPKND